MKSVIFTILAFSAGIAIGSASTGISVRAALCKRLKYLARLTDQHNMARWDELHEAIHELFPGKVMHEDDVNHNQACVRAVIIGAIVALALTVCLGGCH